MLCVFVQFLRLGFESDFAIILNADSYGHPYDYLSITHYPEDAFTKSKGYLTIETIDPQYQLVIGNAKHLSTLVILSLSFLLFLILTIILFVTGQGEDSKNVSIKRQPRQENKTCCIGFQICSLRVQFAHHRERLCSRDGPQHEPTLLMVRSK